MPTGARSDPLVLLVAEGAPWAQDVERIARAAGYLVAAVPSLAAAATTIRSRTVHAMLVDAATLGPSDIVTLRHCRALSPGTTVVAVSTSALPLNLKRALDGGATTHVCWPADAALVEQALGSGAGRAP